MPRGVHKGLLQGAPLIHLAIMTIQGKHSCVVWYDWLLVVWLLV